MLYKKQVMLQLPQHQLIQDSASGWGRTLSMLKQLAEQQLQLF